MASPHRSTSGVDAGWAPFWRYRDLGLCGEQLRHLYGCSLTFAEDIAPLSELTGEDFSLWQSSESRGSFQERARA